jgi:hypothetical protein
LTAARLLYFILSGWLEPGLAGTIEAMFRFRAPEIWLAAVLLAAAVVIVETAAVAQGASPLSFLEQTYKVYRNSTAKGIDTSKPEVIRRHFAPGLAKAMIKDMADARKRNEVPLLNGDPFIDAQDWEISGLKVELMSGATPRRATGVVSFTNAGEPRKVTLDLVKTGDGWRIYDIKAPGGSLREVYKIR